MTVSSPTFPGWKRSRSLGKAASQELQACAKNGSSGSAQPLSARSRHCGRRFQGDVVSGAWTPLRSSRELSRVSAGAAEGSAGVNSQVSLQFLPLFRGRAFWRGRGEVCGEEMRGAEPGKEKKQGEKEKQRRRRRAADFHM